MPTPLQVREAFYELWQAPELSATSTDDRIQALLTIIASGGNEMPSAQVVRDAFDSLWNAPELSYLSTDDRIQALLSLIADNGTGGGGGATNLSLGTTTSTTIDILSDTGTDVTLPSATTSVAGLQSAADKTKLNGIATGATANSSDAQLRDRATHTGSQTASTISDFNTAADARITLQKGAANGIAPLGSDSKVSTTYLPDAVLGALSYQGVWNAATNSPAIPAGSASNKGWYYVVSNSVAAGHGYANVPNRALNAGDWLVSNGSSWDYIDSSDQVSSVNGFVGAVTLTAANVGAQPSDSDLTTIAALTPTTGQLLIFGASAWGSRVLADTDIPNLPASKITTGTLSDSVIPSTIARDSEVTAAIAAITPASIGAQPSDGDLDAIAALSTTSFGRGLLTLADAAALRASAAVGTIATQNANAVAITGGTATFTTVGTAGVTIATGGAITTTGVGLGSVSGNARGAGAVDFQTNRTAATMVASGTYSLLAGINGTASATAAVSLGNGNLVAGANSVGINAANEVISTVNGGFVHGFQAVARRSGERVASTGRFVTSGDAQYGEIMLRNSSVNGATVELVGGLDSQRLVLQNDQTLMFTIHAVARRTDLDNESAGYFAQGVIDRNTNAASTALVGVPIVTAVHEDSTAWNLLIDADTTNGSLRVRFVGETGKTVYCNAFVQFVEVIG